MVVWLLSVPRHLGSILVAWPSPSNPTLATMVVNPGKRKSGVKTMANTRQKLVDSLQVHRDASNSVRAQAMMAMVWQHMEENTEEVASIWEACKAGTFKVRSGPSEFVAEHRYMLKVPKTFMLAWLHSTIDHKFTKHFFKELCYSDRLIVQKVFLMAVRSDGTMPIGCSGPARQ